MRIPRQLTGSLLFLITQCALLSQPAAAAEDYPPHVKPIIEQRCMVCHGCYDAPCQLKMDDWIGLNRGASKNKVYDGTRLLTANLTRLYEDALTTEQWRDKGFYPVLNRDDITQSTLYKMLALKEKYPIPAEDAPLPDSFDFSLDRQQSCPKPSQFGLYNQKRPLQGMPYGFPGVNPDEMKVLADWLHSGAPGVTVAAAGPAELDVVAQWETFFNGSSRKQQLMARYIYEHLFIGNLYFDHLQDRSRWYKLVRSTTPPGQPIDLIATRRPYDSPYSDSSATSFYYRLQPRQTSILDKRHMPYALNPERMQRWTQLFLDPEYTVQTLPDYSLDIAANPFVAFQQLPVDARYRFMLDEAQFTIMAYIKGPVCRGQVALNVIDDRFWVMFAKPNNIDPDQSAAFLAEVSKKLRIPSGEKGLLVTLAQWNGYANRQKEYLQREAKEVAKIIDEGVLDINLDLIWDGGPERNPNAALTIFRHWDSASVVKGFVGEIPKTAWYIDYSLLERIHYLLVAGFDVYGNVGHQLESRLYMDFLRMEGEQNFLLFLPQEQRTALRDHWYRGAQDHVREFMISPSTASYQRDTAVEYQTDDPKSELLGRLRDTLAGAGQHRYQTDRATLQSLEKQQGVAFSLMPEVAFLQVLGREGNKTAYSLLRNSAHSNNAEMFDETGRRIPQEDTLTVVSGFIGSYPNMFFQVLERDLVKFTTAVTGLETASDYTALVERFGVRRNASWFWRLSDSFTESYRTQQPIEAGLFDLNRYQNR